RGRGAVNIHPLRPIEVPVLTETKRLLVRGEYAKAVLFAYPTVLNDVERAFGVSFSVHWTHEEILRRGLPAGTGRLPEFLLGLYRLYEPVRYGRSVIAQGDRLVALLQSVYAHRPMWELYRQYLVTATNGEPLPLTIPGEG
ncbi:MAG: hypothetical protein ACREDK_05970, partial [Thermoplasmata archaeon]